MTQMKTYTPKPADIQRRWWVVDAEGQILGRLASAVATRLRGKDKPIFAPHADTGDFVIVINAEKVRVTGRKLEQKKYYRHSGYPGGFRETTLAEMLAKHPERVIERAVRGMLPKNTLGDHLIKKLKVYAGPTHPHAAQQPQVWQLSPESVGANPK
jgi:large subunit ribosomal protein L13